MNKVLTSLCVFAFTGFILSMGISALGSAVHSVQTVFAVNTPHHHSLLSYERHF
jgi:energy-converting hydrogenase Eha subunit H